MCEKPATSHEHAPPKCIFPETRDLGQDFRKNLISVPSCDVHNSSKSRDDEFLMISLAGIIGNNSIGYQHKLTKVDRALRRSSNRLLDKALLKKNPTQTIKLSENRFIEVIWGTPDVERLNSCFNHIARALHYHHLNYRFIGEVKAHLGYLFHNDKNPQMWAEFIKDRSAIDLADKPLIGSNPDVFYYQVTNFDEFGLFMMRLCFYGGIPIYVAFIPAESNPPSRLEQQLLNAGVRTIFTLGEKTYEFNAEKT